MFFTSDTHFGSERTLLLSKRPFASVSEMNKVIINNWNRIVPPSAEVLHLGDFGDYSVVQRLNGKVTLLLGNYEYDDMKKLGYSMAAMKTMLERQGFADIITDRVQYIGGYPFYLCHEPTHRKEGLFNLFGHIHNLQMVKRFGLNVGVDCHYFRPINLQDVLFYKNGIENTYDENVFIC